MKRLFWILKIGVIIWVVLMLTGLPAFAAGGVDGWLAYQETMRAGLDGLKAYFEFLLELFIAG